MTTWLTRSFAGLLLVLPFVPAVADDPDDKEITRVWIAHDIAPRSFDEITERW